MGVGGLEGVSCSCGSGIKVSVVNVFSGLRF